MLRGGHDGGREEEGCFFRGVLVGKAHKREDQSGQRKKKKKKKEKVEKKE